MHAVEDVPVDELLDIEIPRKKWTREEAQALVDSGFPNAGSLELINGELIDKIENNDRT